jgi:hypothetical protein
MSEAPAVATGSAPDRPGGPPERVRRRPGRIVATASAALLVAVGGGAALALTRTSRTPTNVQAADTPTTGGGAVNGRTSSPGASQPPATSVPAWIPWPAPDGSFTVEFPGGAQQEDVPVAVPQFARAYQVTSVAAVAEYIVVYADLSDQYQVADAGPLLNALVDGATGALGVTTTKGPTEPFLGMPSVAFDGAGTNGGSARGRALISGRRIYLLVASDDGSRTADFDRFLSSFRITG